MATTLPLNIPIPQSAAIASFNYTDIAEATGVVAFYGSVHNENGTKGYFLTTTSSFASDDIITSGASIPGTEIGRISNQSFDVTFNRPQNLKGRVRLMITIGGNANAGSAGSWMGLSGAELFKVSDSVETSLLAVSGARVSISAGSVVSKIQNIEFNLSASTTHFKANDTLRLKLPFWAQNVGAAAFSYGGYGTDPADRVDTTTLDSKSSKLILAVPFLLNLT